MSGTERRSERYSRAMCAQSCVLAIGLGIAFLISSPARVSAKAYEVLTDIGGVQGWGILFLFCGVLLMVAGFRPQTFQAWSLALLGLVTLGLAGTFAWAAARYDTANLTAPVAYGWIALLHLTYAARLLFWDTQEWR